jgi:hypothetical protein
VRLPSPSCQQMDALVFHPHAYYRKTVDRGSPVALTRPEIPAGGKGRNPHPRAADPRLMLLLLEDQEHMI